MSPRTANFELKVGIFVIIGLIVFTFIVFRIGEFKILKPGYKIHIYFNYVSDLDVGAPVNVLGVEVGEVKELNIWYNEKLKRTQVDVTAWIESDVTLRENSIAKVKTLGVFGEKYIELTPGSPDNRPLKDGGKLFGQDPVALEDIAETIERVAEDLDEAIYNVNSVIGDPEVEYSLKESIKNLRVVTERAKSVLTKIDEAQGTIGLLISEDKIYRDLEELVEDIKRHPWKLLHKTREKKTSEEDTEKKSPREGSVFF